MLHIVLLSYIYVYVCICIYMYVYIYIYVYWHCRSIYVSVWNSTIFKHSDIFEQSKMSKWQELWILNKVKSCILLIKQKRPKCHSCTQWGLPLYSPIWTKHSVHTRLCGCNCLRCVCQLIYHDFKVFNLLLGLPSCNKYPFTFFIRWDNVSFVNTYIL